MPATILGQPTMPVGFRTTQSLPTASLVKNLEDDSWTDTHIWYDTKARPIGSFTQNHLGGSTVTEAQLHFSGAVLAANTFHKRLNSDPQVAVRERFEYDSQFRLLKQFHRVDSHPEILLAEYTYNELGQVANKKVGNNLQQIDYAYNIRGWVTKVNNPGQLSTDLFGYEVGFNDSSSPQITEGNFNGNITEVSWKSAGDNVLKRYSYQYDGYNRLLKGNYQEPETTVPQNDYFNEEMSYDRNGNIMTLQRNSKSLAGSFAEQIDDLVYNYDGNRLTSVNELRDNYLGYPDVSGIPIEYDANGSMKDHQDKGILNIDYNILNLPRTIIYNQLYSVRLYLGGPEEERNVTTSYYYRADGVKQKKTFTRGVKGSETTTYTEYLDGFQYESNAPVPVLQFVPTAEGYYNFTDNTYIYQYKDHLGNVRVSYRNQNGGAVIFEEENYYPFGLKHENYLSFNPYQYKYNGKELQADSRMYDYGARFYMPELGRWGVVDPLAEQYRRWSPYNYTMDNPILFVDPDGRGVEYNWGTGTYEYIGNGGRTTLNSQQVSSYLDDQSSFEFKFTGNNIDDGAGSGSAFSGMPYAENAINNIFGNIGDGLNVQEYGDNESCCPDGDEYSLIRKYWNSLADNVISKPIEGAQVVGYIFYGSFYLVPQEMIRKGRMGNIHVKWDMNLWGFKNGTWDKTLEYKDGTTVMSESERFERVTMPAVEAMTLGVGARLNIFENPALNFGFKFGLKYGAKQSIYKNVKH